MWETADELTALHALFDVSFERASEHLIALMTPERRLGADLRIEAEWLVAFAMTDEEMAKIEAGKAARRDP